MLHRLLQNGASYLRWAGWGVVMATLLAATLLLLLRYWILPDIGKFRHDIAAAISRVAGQPVYIDSIHANWDGLRPHLSLQGVRVYDLAGNPALVFPDIAGSLSWRSILYGDPNFHEIVIDRPALVTRRDEEGYLHIAGAVLGKNGQENGFIDWLLRQRQLIINQAIIYWQDDLHKAPTLYLKSVNLRLRNGQNGKHHRFGLQAVPPATVAAPLDIRGDFTGESVQSLSAWRGRLFVQLQNVNLDSLQTWLTLPVHELAGGNASIRAWADLDTGNLVEWIADVALYKTKILFKPHLAALEIDELHGRLGHKHIDNDLGAEQLWFARQFTVGFKDRRRTQPATVEWRVRSGEMAGSGLHSLRITGLDMGASAQLVASLPVENAWQERLSELSPQGVVKHAHISWQGRESESPSFEGTGSFSDLALQSFKGYPSFSGLSGSIDVTPQEGTLTLAAEMVAIGGKEHSTEKIQIDALTGQVDWHIMQDREALLLEFSDIAFASKAGVGVVRGRYVMDSDATGQIDLMGTLAQADIAGLKQYMTWIAADSLPEFINDTLLKGHLSQANFHLQGALNSGQAKNNNNKLSIRAETDITDGAIKLSGDWPEVTGMTGMLSWQDDSLQVLLSTANVSRIKLADLSLKIHHLYTDKATAQLMGLAEGDTGDMLALIQKSPLSQYAGELLSQTAMSGEGRLQVDMTMPVGREDGSALAMTGRYQFINNHIDLGRYVPDLHHVNGTIAFTENSVSFDELHAQALGGPVNFSTISLPEGVLRVSARGQANFDLLQPDIASEPTDLLQLWARFFQGNTAWQATMDIEHDGINIVAESSLEGMKSELPAPFSKTSQESIPVRYEKRFTKPRDDLVRFRYGEIVAVELQRIREKAYHYYPVSGVIAFGNKDILSRGPGTSVHGDITRLEWDRWRDLFKRHGEIDAMAGHSSRGLDGILTASARFDLRVDELEFLGRYFNDAAFTIDKRGKIWRAQVASREMTGDIYWYEEPPQKIVARLSQLTIPEIVQESRLMPRRQIQTWDWPAVDLEAKQFAIQDHALGQLKLAATQQEDGWHVENVTLTYPDSRLQASGIWQNRTPPFRAYSRIQLQSSNIGKLLQRHGYPDRIARGEGELEGTLEWTGKPFSVDFASLSGDLDFTFQRGQFTKLKPGIGKILGIFDLKSLPRRLTFDFYDVFGKGFGFDYFHGNIAIKDGIATADDLHITGSAADLAVSGMWNLVEETQSLNMKVFPSLGLVTPVAGIAAMIATQTLQDPFDRVLLSEYAITGGWSEPVVIKLDDNNDRTGAMDKPPVLPEAAPESK